MPIDVAKQVLIRYEGYMFAQPKIPVRVGGSALSDQVLLAVQPEKLSFIFCWLSLLDIIAHPLICSSHLVFCQLAVALVIIRGFLVDL